MKTLFLKELNNNEIALLKFLKISDCIVVISD